MDSLSIAASGIRSASVRMSASAHNLANLTTASFRPLRIDQTSDEEGGSSARLTRASAPEEVDVAREIISQIRARTQFGGSLRVFGADAEMRGKLIDMTA